MKPGRLAACAAMATALVWSGCSTVSSITAPVRNLWSGGPQEQSRERQGALNYGCDAGKKLTLVFDAPKKAAWVILPDREYRLDSVGSDAGTRYSNGSTGVTVNGEEVTMDEGGVVTFAHCRQAQK